MIVERRRNLKSKRDPERRDTPRLNIGKVNYDSMMRVLHKDEPYAQWESLTLVQRAAISAAASTVVDMVLNSQHNKELDQEI